MGMPISTYTVLRALTKRADVAPYEAETAAMALTPFNLYAFVIHDPQRHQQFAKFLSQEFDHLDYVSGENLLFFALVHASSEWMQVARHRPYFQHYDSWASTELGKQPGVVFESRETPLAVCLALRIPYDILPVVMVAQTFGSETARWARTSEQLLPQQLRELGYAATRQPQIKVDRTLFDRVVSNLSRLDQPHSGSDLSVPMANALSDVLAAVVAADGDLSLEGGQRARVRRQARSQARESLVALQRTLRDFKANMFEACSEQFDELALRIASVQSLLLPRQFATEMPLEAMFLDAESEVILETGLRVLRHLAQNEEDCDFTACAICFAKVFEKESSLSAVHWIRQYLGVDLPQYFRRYHPGLDARIRTTAGTVNFNKEVGTGGWQPPELGRSGFCYRHLVEKNIVPTGFPLEKARVLADHWDAIREMRNCCAHQDLFSQEEAEALLAELQFLTDAGLFELLFHLKSVFSGTE